METVTLTIDGQQVTVAKGKTVLQAAIESDLLNTKAAVWAQVLRCRLLDAVFPEELVDQIESLVGRRAGRN